MLLKPIAVAAAGLAAATQAFLLPPEVSESDVEIVKTIDFVPDIAKARVVELACPGCPVEFLGKGGQVHVKTDRPNHLLLAFAVDEQSGSDRLLLNDFELYPNSDPFHSSLIAPQVPDSRGRPAHRVHKEHEEQGEHKEHKGLKGRPDRAEAKNGQRKHHKHHRPILSPQLGFGLQVQPVAMSKEDSMQIISLDLQIIEVGTTFVDGIPNVHIKLLKDPNGKLMIGSIETTTSQTLQTTPMEKQEECATLLCKWIAIVQDKFKNMKGFKQPCHGNKKGGAVDGSEHDRTHKGGRPHKMEHGQVRHHSWRRLLKNIVRHILLPVLIGIVAGVSVSLIGMLFGTMIVSVWRFFFRGSSRRHVGHSHHRAAQKEVAVAEEKSSLMEHQDPPPEYEEEETETDAEA